VLLFSHVTVGVNDLSRAGRFYDAILEPLGLRRRPVTPDGGPPSLCWIRPGESLPRFYAYSPFNGLPATPGNGSMVAFLAPSEAAVIAAHAAGLAAGGTDEGAPGPRPHYGDGYFGAYLRDPDGNKVHIVYRGDITTQASTSGRPAST
jgi:Lactoylglutathione lyase and related lyases